jgi:DNA mismatch repair protein MutS2
MAIKYGGDESVTIGALADKMYYNGRVIKDVIDLHGMRAESAEQSVYRFINEMIRKHSKKALIIHGKGAGVLKEVTDDCLRQNGYVSKFYIAPLEYGGSGATVVEFSY